MIVPTVLFVGDSITVGSVGSSDKTGFRGPLSLRVPGVVHVGPFIDPKGLRHGGVGGATTDTLLNKTTFVKSSSTFVVGSVKVAPTWIDLYKPTYLHLMIGTNDLITKGPPSDDIALSNNVNKISDSVATMVALAHKSNPATKIIVSSIPVAGPDWFSDEARTLNRVYKSRAATGAFGPGVVFSDTAAPMNAAFDQIASSVTSDGTHPNDKGYGLLAEGAATVIRAAPASEPSGSSGGVERVALAAGGAYVAYRVWRWWTS